MKVLIAAGGSGGHLFPAKMLAEALDGRASLFFAGARLKENPFFQRNWPCEEITADTKHPGKILQGIFQSIKLLRSWKIDRLVGFGSYHTLPLIVAAAVCRVPYLLFAPDLYPGKVLRWGSWGAKATGVVFSESGQWLHSPIWRVRMPVSPQLVRSELLRKEGFSYFGLEEGRLTLLVFGGSQGAQGLNQIVANHLELPGGQVIHLTGRGEELIRECYQRRGLKACVKAFENQMPYAWNVADMAICRAGALSLSESVAMQVPTLFVPYPYASENHQEKNARFIEKLGAGYCCLEADLRGNLNGYINKLLQGRERLQSVLLRYWQEVPQTTFADKVIEWLDMSI